MGRGEVFLLEYFEDIFKIAARFPHLRQKIVTNGLLINEKWAEMMAKSNLVLSFSIDGVTKETYEYVRKGARFDDLIKNIKIVNRFRDEYDKSAVSPSKMVTRINFVVMKSNYHELERVLDFAKEYNFYNVAFTPVARITNDENVFHHKNVKVLKQIEMIRPVLAEKACKYGIVLYNALTRMNRPGGLLRDNEGNGSKVREFTCLRPWRDLFISSGGWVKPGCFCLKHVGNVTESTLETIWNNETMQWYRRKILNNEYKELCGSDCISRFRESKPL